jgi:hypothetical protein
MRMRMAPWMDPTNSLLVASYDSRNANKDGVKVVLEEVGGMDVLPQCMNETKMKESSIKIWIASYSQ